MRKLRAMLSTYREAGGAQPIVLLHDGEHGAELIDALARHGDGLPANVLPLAVNEVTQVGLEAIAGGLRLRRGAVRFLAAGAAAPRHRRPARRRSRWRADPRGPRFGGRARLPPSRPTIRTRSATALRAIEAMDGGAAAGKLCRRSAASAT